LNFSKNKGKVKVDSGYFLGRWLAPPAGGVKRIIYVEHQRGEIKMKIKELPKTGSEMVSALHP